MESNFKTRRGNLWKPNTVSTLKLCWPDFIKQRCSRQDLTKPSHFFTTSILACTLTLFLSFGFKDHLLKAIAPSEKTHPVQIQPPEHPLRLVTLGTSLTARSKWPETLSEHLETCTGTAVHLIKIARSGANSDWGIAQIDKVARIRADIVVIEFAINDADLFDGISLTESYDNHLKMIEILQLETPETQIMLMTTNPVLGLQRWKRPLLSEYYASYRDISLTLGVAQLDMTSTWAKAFSSKGARKLVPDGIHPSEKAINEFMLPAIVRKTASILKIPHDC